MIWFDKRLPVAFILFVVTILAAATGRVPWPIPAVIGLALLLIFWSWIRTARTDPLGNLETGHIVAVDISINRRSWYLGNEEPLSTSAIVRLPSGETKEVATSAVELPRAVRKQVFSSSWAIRASSWSTNLAIRDRNERRSAIEQARHGTYRFNLPEPVPVQIRRSKKGRLDFRAV